MYTICLKSVHLDYHQRRTLTAKYQSPENWYMAEIHVENDQPIFSRSIGYTCLHPCCAQCAKEPNHFAK